MTRKPESTNELLNRSVFRSLVDQVAQHGVILRLVRNALPVSLAEHCKDCLVKEGRLVIFTDSPAWASQLRFFAPVILADLRSYSGHDFREIQLRNLRLEAPADKPKPMNLPSPEVAHRIKASGLDTPSDELREALARLGATMERYAGYK